jgi:hypothetical protein
MSKIVEAEYLAQQNVLRLAEPLVGIGDHERVLITIDESAPIDHGAWPTLSEEAGRELASAVKEAFGRDVIAV